jgi:hypothetical protein
MREYEQHNLIRFIALFHIRENISLSLQYIFEQARAMDYRKPTIMNYSWEHFRSLYIVSVHRVGYFVDRHYIKLVILRSRNYEVNAIIWDIIQLNNIFCF